MPDKTSHGTNNTMNEYTYFIRQPEAGFLWSMPVVKRRFEARENYALATWFSSRLADRKLFPDAKRAENGVEQILRGRPPDDLADGIGADSQIDGDQVKRCAGPELFPGYLE